MYIDIRLRNNDKNFEKEGKAGTFSYNDLCIKVYWSYVFDSDA